MHGAAKDNFNFDLSVVSKSNKSVYKKSRPIEAKTNQTIN